MLGNYSCMIFSKDGVGKILLEQKAGLVVI